MLISIAWGWTLIHMQHDNIYILIGIIATFLDVGAMILHHSVEDTDHIHHNYDNLVGKMIIFLRILLWMIFTVGIFRTMT